MQRARHLARQLMHLKSRGNRSSKFACQRTYAAILSSCSAVLSSRQHFAERSFHCSHARLACSTSISAAYCSASCDGTAQLRVSVPPVLSPVRSRAQVVWLWLYLCLWARLCLCAQHACAACVGVAADAHCRHPRRLGMVRNRLVGRNQRLSWNCLARHLSFVPTHQILVGLSALIENHLVVTKLLSFD